MTIETTRAATEGVPRKVRQRAIRWWTLLALVGCGRIAFEPVAGSPAGGSDARQPDDSMVAADARVFAHNVMFVTSTRTSPGALGGLTGADALCNARASDAGLQGTYVAWLSTSTVDAYTRLGTARGWVRPDGAPFVDQVADLTAGRILYPPWIDELGVVHAPPDFVTSDAVVTGTARNGRGGGLNWCGDYTQVATAASACGEVAGGTELWTDSGEGSLSPRCSCDIPTRLYCFGIDKTEPVTVPIVTGLRAFVSSAWMPGGGLSDADAKCQADAAGAGVGGTFRALLSTTTSSAASRFAAIGEGWRRMDGLELAESRAAFMDAYLLAPLDRDASGAPALYGVWTGGGFGTGSGARPSDLGGAAYDCAAWTVGTNAELGGGGFTHVAGRAFFARGGSSCNATSSGLYCLEE